jgi:hypothetical protein
MRRGYSSEEYFNIARPGEVVSSAGPIPRCPCFGAGEERCTSREKLQYGAILGVQGGPSRRVFAASGRLGEDAQQEVELKVVVVRSGILRG